MKSFIRYVCAVTAGLVLLSGCSGQQPDSVKKDTDKTMVQSTDRGDGDQGQTKPVDPSTEKDGQGHKGAKAEKAYQIYVPDADWIKLETKEAKTAELTPQWLIDQLADAEILTADVKVVHFKQSEADGKKSIDLDLNKPFADRLSSSGTTGEEMMMGSVCNTFLDAYDCEQIKVTVDGKALSTGHAIYDKYMTRY